MKIHKTADRFYIRPNDACRLFGNSLTVQQIYALYNDNILAGYQAAPAHPIWLDLVDTLRVAMEWFSRRSDPRIKSLDGRRKKKFRSRNHVASGYEGKFRESVAYAHAALGYPVQRLLDLTLGSTYMATTGEPSEFPNEMIVYLVEKIGKYDGGGVPPHTVRPEYWNLYEKFHDTLLDSHGHASHDVHDEVHDEEVHDEVIHDEVIHDEVHDEVHDEESNVSFAVIGDIKIERTRGEPLAPPVRPHKYRYACHGDAAAAVTRVARAVKYGNSVFLYGAAGTGKSDLFRAIAYDTNREFSLYPMREDLDTAAYIGQMEVVVDPDTGVNKTEYRQGRLLQDLQGRVGKDGVRRPVMILIDDIDRAPAEYHEVFRHIMDGSRSVFVPELGQEIPVFEGTQIMATANSVGQGDATGFYTSVQVMDDSILDRFDRFIEMHYLSWDDEYEILAQKYPDLDSGAIISMLKVADALRSMSRAGEIMVGFSHRVLDVWARSYLEMAMESPNTMTIVQRLQASAHDWMERFDPITRSIILDRAVKIFI